MTLTLAERRSRYIALAQRRVYPGSGSSIEHLRRRTSVQPLFDLRRVIRSTRFLLVGGLATRYSMPEYTTLDTDVLVLAEDRIALEEELAGAGCRRLGGAGHGWIDLDLAQWDDAGSDRTPSAFSGDGLRQMPDLVDRSRCS